jgi:hypothetical protein
VQVIKTIKVLAQPGSRVQPGVIQMAGIQAQSGGVMRNVRRQPVDFVGELDAAAGVRMHHRPHAVFPPGQFADARNVPDHPLPLPLRQTRR